MEYEEMVEVFKEVIRLNNWNEDDVIIASPDNGDDGLRYSNGTIEAFTTTESEDV